MRTDSMILGKGCAYSMNCEETQLNNNVLVCGSSGSGKTMSITEPMLLETENTSLVVTLSKRRLVDKYKALFKKRGYRVMELNFVHPLKSDVAYDPLTYVKSHQDIVFLAESIVKSDPKKKDAKADPYWDAASVSLFSAETAYTMMAKGYSLTNVLEFHNSLEFSDGNGTIETTLDDKFNEIKRMDSKCFALSCWKSFRQLPMRTASCVYGTLNTTLDTLFPPELRKMMAMRRKVDFTRIASEKTVLFVYTSPVNPSLDFFVSLFYSQLFKQLFEFAEDRDDGKLPLPVHVICDDFATGSTIRHFPQYISIFREKQLSVTLLLQSESQLAAMYGADDATTIINNCDTFVFMGNTDLKTCRSVSEKMNVPLDEIMFMPLGREIILRRGQKPVITERYDIRENECHKRLMRQHEKSSAFGEKER